MTFWSILRQRCWGLVLVVAGVCVITFIISHLIPGDPARLLAGDRASDAIVENIRQQLGLDQPLYVQFYRYVSDLFHGDLGTSIRTGRPVLEGYATSISISRPVKTGLVKLRNMFMRLMVLIYRSAVVKP